MKPRDSILIISGAALVGVIVTMLLAMGGGGMEPGSNLPPAAVADPPSAAMPLAPVEARPAPMTSRSPDQQRDLSGMTSGIIRGNIVLSPDVVNRIRSMTVIVQELGGDPPYSRQRRVVMGRGTPGFEFTGIPFSPHGFSVSVFSPGLNGSEHVVAVTEQAPIADAVLGITPPVPFSILLRDQFESPVSEMNLSMQPVDLPPGRPPLNGQTDNFGSLLFEEVLAGDYLIYVDNPTHPLVKPVRVTVQPPGVTFQPAQLHLRGRPLEHQFSSIRVPRGQALLVSVAGPAGRGLKDAKLTLLPTTSRVYQPYEGVTDYTGRYTFAHLPPGEYELNVELAGHQRRTLTLRWKEGEEPPQPDVVMYPRRN